MRDLRVHQRYGQYNEQQDQSQRKILQIIGTEDIGAQRKNRGNGSNGDPFSQGDADPLQRNNTGRKNADRIQQKLRNNHKIPPFS